MTRILIVEDDEYKTRQLRGFVEDRYREASIVLTESLQGGLRNLMKAPFDLVLLDMSIPNYDPGPEEPGGTSYVRGGQELLREMQLYEILVPVIVVTQYDSFGTGKERVSLEDLDAELRADHGDLYYGAVYYNSALQSWKEQLETLMSAALAARS